MKIIKDTFKKIALAVALCVSLAAAVPEAEGQTAYDTIPLPFSILTGAGSPVVTNLTAGWSVITVATNVTTVWSNSIAAMVSYTNTTSYTNTRYADFFAKGQDYVPISSLWTSTGTGSNIIYWVSRSGSGLRFPTNLSHSAVSAHTNSTSAASVVGQDLIDMRGYQFGRIIWVKWDTTASVAITNGEFSKGNKLN
jgi:hypothetical protein